MASFMLHLVIGLLFTIASVLAVPAAGTCTAANRLAIVHLLFDNVFAGNTAAIYITPAADNITIALYVLISRAPPSARRSQPHAARSTASDRSRSHPASRPTMLLRARWPSSSTKATTSRTATMRALRL